MLASLTSLTDKNGFIKIAALDHRDSLKKFLLEAEIHEFKITCVESFSPYTSAFLLNPDFWEKEKTNLRWVKNLALSMEESGYLETSAGRETELNEKYDAFKLKELGATALKLLIYFNPEAKNKNEQVELVKKAKNQADIVGLPLVLEIITYHIEGTSHNKGEAILNSCALLKNYADVLKLEYPGDDYISKFSILDKPWVLLSRGIDFESYKRELKNAKELGKACGYAVGRAVWKEISDYKTWEEKRYYLRTVASNRMRELADIFT